ncbi:MAG: cytochrome c biogenesis protein CcdA [bacterium]
MRNIKYTSLCLFLMFFLVLISFSLKAQAYISEVDENHPFTLSFDDSVPLVLTQQKTDVDFFFRIPKKHVLYKESIRVELDNKNIHQELIKPLGILKDDPFMGGETEIYEKNVVVNLKMHVMPDFDFSEDITGKIYYQGCSDNFCYRVVKTDIVFTVDLDSVITQKKETIPHQQEEKNWLSWLKITKLQDLLNEGLFFALLITFLAGLFTAFTPCVLPIIPLTLALLGVSKKQPLKARLNNLLIFVLGMSVMYAVLGVLVASLGLTLGFIFQSRVFILILVIFLLFFALWLFDFFSLSLPPSVQKIIANYKPKGSKGFLYIGLTMGLLAAPCVGPILGPILVYIASTRDLLTGYLLMQSYALGLSVLFFVIGFISSSWLPKVGKGGAYLKKIMGVLLIITAIYFSWIFVNSFLNHDNQGHSLFYNQLPIAQEKAKKDNKIIMIDYAADWCVPCLKWDKQVFSQALVQNKLLKDFVSVKIDCTHETKICEEAISQYQIVGWPSIVFIKPDGVEMKAYRIVGTVMSAEDFLKYLDEILGAQ